MYKTIYRQSILLILFFISFLSAFSQSDSTIVDDEKEQKWKFIFEFDNRRSFVLDKPAPFSGLKIGAEYMSVHDFGIGFYSTQQPVRAIAKNHQNEVLAQIDYTTLFYQYAFYQNHKWEFAVPFHLGGGSTDIKEVYKGTNDVVLDPYGNERIFPQVKFSVIEFGVNGQYKIFRWFGIGSGLGYRFTLKSNENAKYLINAPIYSFKFKIFLGQLWKTIRGKD